MVESDSKVTISRILKPNLCPWALWNLSYEIQDIRSVLGKSKVIHISWKVNNVADALDKEGVNKIVHLSAWF